ncbi:MAG: PAAR domain-containing protein [Minicystis sp.]
MSYVVNEAKLPWPAETLDMSALVFKKGDVEVFLQRELSDDPVAERLERDLVRLRRSTTGFRTIAVEAYDHPFPGGKAVRLRFDTDKGPRFEAHLRFRHRGTMFDSDRRRAREPHRGGRADVRVHRPDAARSRGGAMSLEPAARIEDPVTHTNASEGRFLAETAVDIAFLFIPGPEEIVILKYVYRGGSVLARWAVKKLVRAANKKISDEVTGAPKKAAKAVAGAIGDKLGQLSMDVAGEIVEGSEDVFTNLRNAARVGDEVDCDDTTIAMGSDCVSIDQKPAARRYDPTKCGGMIADGSEDVIMGGVPVPAIGGLTGKTPDEKHDVAKWQKVTKKLGMAGAKKFIKTGSLTEAGKGVLDNAKDQVKDYVTDQYKDAGKQVFDKVMGK